MKQEKNILIIDDEEEICILLSYALRKLGYHTDYSLTVASGKQKLDDFSPDLVLLDLHLPDGSGFSVIPKIKEKHRPFLVISAHDDGKEKALSMGAAKFIKKPFDLEGIARAIMEVTNGNS